MLQDGNKLVAAGPENGAVLKNDAYLAAGVFQIDISLIMSVFPKNITKAV